MTIDQSRIFSGDMKMNRDYDHRQSDEFLKILNNKYAPKQTQNTQYATRNVS